MSDTTPHGPSMLPNALELGALPEDLRAEVAHCWERLLTHAAGLAAPVPLAHEDLAVLPRVWAASPFVAEAMAHSPALLADLSASGDLARAYRDGEVRQRVDAALAGIVDETALARALRHVRQREMVRIAWRDLAGRADLDETLAALSDLADACVDAALTCLHAWQSRERGEPRTAAGAPQQLVVLGLGKLGGRELNFSSDIDLIFAFPESGETDSARPISNEEYFTRLARRLIQALDRTTEDGFVFRVDVRLRPYGDSGPLVTPFAAMEGYYQLTGREWERYALIKARVIAGDQAAGAALLAQLRPFVYRRYLDFSAFEALRSMKAMIAREVARRGLEGNVKLGAGGIREVEFIVQAFQLVRGGHEPELQDSRLLPVLAHLAERGRLPRYVADGLRDAYVLLRRVENRIQALRDRQEHALPQDERDRLRLALAMDRPDWAALAADVANAMALVREHFEQVFGAPQAEAADGEGDPQERDRLAVWQDVADEEDAHTILAHAGYQAPEQALAKLQEMRNSPRIRGTGEQGRRRLDRLMPLLIGAVGGTEAPDVCLQRVLDLVTAIAGRTTYLSLLVEHPVALSQLVRLCAVSPWIARHLTLHPVLLDELLDPRTLYAPSDAAALQALLEQEVGPMDGDLERQMDGLRRFQQTSVLRVAAADVTGAMPLMVVSDRLVDVAEVVLKRVLALGWAHLLERHGRPRCEVAGRVREPGFAIVGYGKLGGLELGYGSDLDLVFLHDSQGEAQQTDGPRPVDNAVFFSRLGQRIIHLLTTHTPAGILYDVDMRLRPSGASGLLVSGIDAFERYQREQAWTWEHQALVRARVVAGDAALKTRFEAVRHAILAQPRDAEELRGAVRDMRERMRRELRRGTAGQFDLKQDAGGIVDIEFMVQYGVLRWAHEYPDLTRYTDTLRILEDFVRLGLMDAPDAQTLADAYRAYRARGHRLTLQEAPTVVAESEFNTERSRVTALWRQWLEMGSAGPPGARASDAPQPD